MAVAEVFPSSEQQHVLSVAALASSEPPVDPMERAIVEAGGVGYDVTIAVPTFTKLPDVGAEVRLRIHTHVREDALSLYGFLSQDEKALFEKLISVSGTLGIRNFVKMIAPKNPPR